MTREERYFELIQQTAKKKNSMFFMDCGEGNEIIDELYEGEDFSGWLIPLELSNQFSIVWSNDQENHDDFWYKYYVFAEWHKDDDGKVFIEFNSYEN